MITSPLCEMLGIQYPIFQGGMAWIADAKLAAAVSNAGGLGIISAMNAGPDYLREQIAMAKSLTDKPFGVNIMLQSPFADDVAKVVAEESVKIVTTGAGTPTKVTFPAENRLARAENVKDVASYIERIDEMIDRKEKLLSKLV